MRRGMQTRSMPAEFRAEETDGRRVIEGYFAVFGAVYSPYGDWEETIAPGAFAGQTEADVRALINHDTTLVLGRVPAGTLTLREDGRGLWGRLEINAEDQDAVNCWARVRRRDVTQCSIGFDILDEEKTVDPQTGRVRFTIRRVKLYEVSVVTFPAYEDTGVEARCAQAGRERARALEAWRETMRRRLGHGAQTAAAGQTD